MSPPARPPGNVPWRRRSSILPAACVPQHRNTSKIWRALIRSAQRQNITVVSYVATKSDTTYYALSRIRELLMKVVTVSE